MRDWSWGDVTPNPSRSVRRHCPSAPSPNSCYHGFVRDRPGKSPTEAAESRDKCPSRNNPHVDLGDCSQSAQVTRVAQVAAPTSYSETSPKPSWRWRSRDRQVPMIMTIRAGAAAGGGVEAGYMGTS